MPKLLIPGFCALLLLASQPALAGDMQGMKMSGHDDPFPQSTQDMKDMMDVPLTGDIDTDFVAKMLPHHQGAVDMAKVELERGKDPELKKLAADIVRSQDKEIAFMKAWQKRHTR